MEQFLETWSKIVGDLEEELSDNTMKRILFQKIKDSTALRPFLDKYNMMDETDPEHTYTYLVGCMERYLL